MSRQPESRSKSTYQGMILKRTQRSEYDDHQLRDLARHDARLDNEIRNVERARTVMKKSMEADKQLFIKAGSQNVKVTQSRHSTTAARQAALLQVTAQQSRLVSDTRVKKSSLSDSDVPDLASRPDGAPVSTAHRSNKSSQIGKTDHKSRGDRGENSTNNKHNLTKQSDSTMTDSDSKKELRTVPSNVTAQNADSLYDSFLLDKVAGGQSPPGSVPGLSAGQVAAKPVVNIDSDSRLLSDQREARGASQAVEKRSSDEKDVSVVSSNMDRVGLSSDARGAVSGNARTKRSEPEAVKVRHVVTGEDPPRRPRNKWDVLATPKHSSSHLSKRAQIEREFSATKPSNGEKSTEASKSTTPAATTLLLSSSSPSTVSAAAAAGGIAGPGLRKKSAGNSQSQQRPDATKGRIHHSK